MSSSSCSPDSLSQQAVRWMDGKGIDIADATRNLIASLSVWSNDCGRVSIQRLHVPVQPQVTTAARNHFFQLCQPEGGKALLCLSSLQSILSHQEPPLLQYKDAFPIPLCQIASCVTPPESITKVYHLHWQNLIFYSRQPWSSVHFTDEFTWESNSGHLLIWREQ